VLLQGGINVQNVVQGNLIGTDVNGTAALGNTLSGVQVLHSIGNTIGGTTAAARNVISGNVQNGVHLLNSGTTGTLVQGNFIGTDINGTADLGNVGDGVLVQSSASNTIGGTAVGSTNVISGNNRFGIEITDATSTGNLVQGNLIGTKANGTEALGNTFSGVAVLAGSNTIGGASVAARNVISGNLHNGVWLTTSAATGNLVQGNFIGTDSTGAADLGNAQIGVKVDGTASSNTIGGTAAVAGNVISGNDQHGVLLLSPGVAGNLVQGNLIGTDAGGTANVGNTLRGVWIANASSNTVGGSTAGASNTVAFNGGSGVLVSGLGTGNAIQQNSMFSNAGLGIDLGPEGINPNDAASGNEDADAGVNNLQNFPVIAAAVLSGMNLNVTYSVPSATANSAYPLTVEFYLADAAGQEGRTFLGSDSYAAGSATMSTMATVPAGSAALGNTIVATATDANGNTSEFSAGVTVAAPLMAAENRGSNFDSPGLEEEQLGSIVEAAIARFVASGLSDQELAALSAVSFAIADLPGATLGLSNGHMITLDINAAGYGWFFDPTPLVDEEFLAGDSFGLQSRPEYPAAQQMDLLSAVMHELGHVLGYDDHHSASHLDDVMSAILQPGIRRTTGFDAADAVFSDGLWADG
jgi:titin